MAAEQIRRTVELVHLSHDLPRRGIRAQLHRVGGKQEMLRIGSTAHPDILGADDILETVQPHLKDASGPGVIVEI